MFTTNQNIDCKLGYNSGLQLWKVVSLKSIYKSAQNLLRKFSNFTDSLKVFLESFIRWENSFEEKTKSMKKPKKSYFCKKIELWTSVYVFSYPRKFVFKRQIK